MVAVISHKKGTSKMSFEGFSEIREGNNSILQARPAWLSYISHFFGIGLSFLLDVFRVESAVFFANLFGIIISHEIVKIVHIVLLATPIFLICKIVFHRYRRKYKIQNSENLLYEFGYIAKHEHSIPINKLSIETRQSIMGRVFGFGNLYFRPGTEGIQCSWEGLINPRSLRKDIEGIFRERTFSPEGTALHGDPVKEARELKRTGFGDEGLNSSPPKQCENWIIHGDGTATDENSRLMWIQAPWGKKWTGTCFTGDAVKLNWPDATELFGKGCRGSYDNEKNMAHLTEKNFADTAYEHGYTHGCCTVHFAGYTDWRLPTAIELRNFLLLDETTTYRKVMKEVFLNDIRDDVWSATPKSVEFTYTGTLRFILNIQKALGRKGLYQNALGQTCIYQNAWRFTFGSQFGRYIDEGQEFPFKILFVRQVK